jgi:hypothetical protein
MKRPKRSERKESIEESIESVNNKLEIIKTDTNNINRILSLSNSDIIVQELRKIIGGSKVRAAILHLTKEKIGTRELADAIGMDEANLSRDITPFLGTKGYLVQIREGKKKYYLRSQLVDLVEYESIEDFSKLIQSWQTKRAAKPTEIVTEKAAKDGI